MGTKTKGKSEKCKLMMKCKKEWRGGLLVWWSRNGSRTLEVKIKNVNLSTKVNCWKELAYLAGN